ncbi:hypothetical protein QQF64_031288 [Cirrhinus molitorella]|uniref:Uncharacterized protein n=1 Tax=Cirrhinus molitorella TaxID=172907 RepID=A0ABR3MWI4_9TELE
MKTMTSCPSQGPDPESLRKLRTEADLVLAASKKLAQGIGSLVVLHRHLWLTLTEMQDAEKRQHLDSPVSPQGLFGEAFSEKYTEALKQSKMLPHLLQVEVQIIISAVVRESTSYPCLPDSRALSFAASQYRTATIEASTPFYEQTANVMPAPHSTLKGQISASAPPTLYGRSASLDQHASPSYVVSPDPYSPPARTPHYSFSGMSHGANDLSYPPQQQRA